MKVDNRILKENSQNSQATPQCNLSSVVKCFIRAGFSVVPVKPNSKEPSISWKFYQTQYMDSNLINRFFHDSSNLAVVTGRTSNLTVIDVDDLDKFNDFYEFDKLMAQAGVVVKSPKGWHLWFKYDPKIESKQHQSYGFDVKSDGGLIIAPPSRVNGHAYFFEKSENLSEIPEEFKERLLSLQELSKSASSLWLEEILNRLRVSRQLPDGTFRCYCPAHDDKEPSLDVGIRNSKFYIKCWAGCSEEEVLNAIGIEPELDTKGMGRNNASRKLLQLVEGFEVWTNQNGEEFITLPEGNMRIDSKDFRKYLQVLFYQKYGKPAHTQAILEAISTLSGKALFEGKKLKSFIRIGKKDELVELDLINGFVQITKDKITITNKSFCKFERPANLLPLPTPDLDIEGDEWQFLKHFINTTDEEIVLTLAWLVGCFNLEGEFPILNIVGEREGIGKTTTTKFLKNIIDPSIVPIKPMPKSEDDLLTICLHNHIVAFDNISSISDSLSDALCRISTGSGLAKRKLFTDADAVLYFVKNPVILNGIDLFAERRDLRRRCLHIELKRLERPIPIEKLESDFASFHSKIFGWLCRAVQLALREKIDSDFNLTDMASFVSFICRIERIFPIPSRSFVETFETNRLNASISVVIGDPIVSFLNELTEAGDWIGSMTELFELFLQKNQNSVLRMQTPKNVKSFGKRIRRLLTDLENLGIICLFFKTPNANFIHIKKVSKSLSTNSNIPQILKIKESNNGVFMEREEKTPSNSIETPCQNPLKNKAFGMSGVLETKNSTFLMDDVIDGSDIDPDDIEIIEDE